MKKKKKPFDLFDMKEVGLLPFYFKNIGLGILLFLLLSVLFNEFTLYWEDYKTTCASLFKTLFIIALLFILISKNRIEDERTLQIRIKAYAGAMLCSVGGFVFHKLLHLFPYFETDYEMTVTEFIMIIFICYYLISQFLKRKL